jgi:RNA polymerase sigma factor (sigma-70 family)
MLTHTIQSDYTSKQKTMNEKNFGLTADEFQSLRERLQEQGDETLIKHIFESQYRNCRDLLMSKYGASYDNAHEVVMDVLLKFREDLIAGKFGYDNLVSFFKTQSWQTYVKATDKSKRLIFVDPSVSVVSEVDLKLLIEEDNIAELIEKREVMTAFRQAYCKLCERCQGLLNRHYSEDLQWKQIGQMDNKTAGSIRVEALECRKKLKTYFQDAL